ncbi:MAG TPA: hypothetical protein VHU44_07940 [Acidobacteriaceae bacterium]|nr:hypothetical protein [Acidobacteriaceae bacterium]
MDALRSTNSAARTADTLLRAIGGRTVILRLPAPAAPLVSEQLGLATPYFQDVPLAPVVFRKARAQSVAGKPVPPELLVSATVVERTVGSLEYASASVLFATALGIVIDDELFTIENAATEQAFGNAYLYRLTLRAPLAQIV